jgi:hypothetical protein
VERHLSIEGAIPRLFFICRSLPFISFLHCSSGEALLRHTRFERRNFGLSRQLMQAARSKYGLSLRCFYRKTLGVARTETQSTPLTPETYTR